MQCKAGVSIENSLGRAVVSLDRVERESKILVPGVSDVVSMRRNLREARKVHLAWAAEWSEHLKHCKACQDVDGGEE
jgi:hypothetical protein